MDVCIIEYDCIIIIIIILIDPVCLGSIILMLVQAWWIVITGEMLVWCFLICQILIMRFIRATVLLNLLLKE